MRGLAGTITRAGLFLLFAVALVVLAPAHASADAAANLRAGTAESKTEGGEHRDSEKPRERSPGAVLSRVIRHGHRQLRRLILRVLRSFHPCVERPLAAKVVQRRERLDDECARSRYAPALLQVYRR